MNRICPECGNNQLKVRLLSYSNRMYCSSCFSRFEYSSAALWFLSFMGALWSSLAIVMGILSGSWVVFAILFIVAPFGIELVFAKYCSLKLVGVKALRKNRRNGL